MLFICPFAFAQGNKYALLIAIGDYPEDTKWKKINSLNDINLVKEVLLNKGFSEDQGIQMLSGITSALSGNQLSAQSLMVGITKSADPMLALQAEFNLKVVQGVNPEQGATSEFKLPSAVIQQFKAVEMSSLRNLSKTMLSGSTGAYFISRPDASDTKTFSFGDQNGAVMSFKRKKNRSLSALSLFEKEMNLIREGFEQIITTPLGYYLVSVPDLAILKLDQNGKLLEILRVIKHR